MKQDNEVIYYGEISKFVMQKRTYVYKKTTQNILYEACRIKMD